VVISVPRAERIAAIRERLIAAAVVGRPVTYRAVHRNPRAAGGYLFEIAAEERAAGRPPLTAIVVHSGPDRRPGSGFEDITRAAGRWRDAESLDQNWARVANEVYTYWRQRRASRP
jgi:hypothetical protein